MNTYNTNVLILGKTGSGKSALVNYLYGQNIAVAKVGRPVTERGLHRHPPFMWNDIQVSVFDSWGLESSFIDDWKEDLYAALRSCDQSQDIGDWFHTVIYCCDARKGQPDSCEQKKVLDELRRKGVRLIFALTRWGLCRDQEKEAALKNLRRLYPDAPAVPVEAVSQKLRNGTVTSVRGREELFQEMCLNLRDNLLSHLCAKTREELQLSLKIAKKRTMEVFETEAGTLGVFRVYSDEMHRAIRDKASDFYYQELSRVYSRLHEQLDSINAMSVGVIKSYTGIDLAHEKTDIARLTREKLARLSGWSGAASEYVKTCFMSLVTAGYFQVKKKERYRELLEKSVNNVNFEILDDLDNYINRLWQNEKLVREALVKKLTAEKEITAPEENRETPEENPEKDRREKPEESPS